MKLPLYHDLVAEGVPEDKAMKWHNAIMGIMAHADSMSMAIRYSESHVQYEYTPKEAAGFYEDWKKSSPEWVAI